MPTYNCNICNISTTLKSNFNRHLKTNKHINNVNKLGNENEKGIKNPPIYSEIGGKSENLLQFPSDFGGKNEEKNEKLETVCSIINDTKKNNYNKEHHKYKFVCSHCDQVFSRKDNLKRHLEERCKITNKNIDYKKLFYEMKNEFEKEKEEFKKQIELLLTKVGNTTTINNTQNIQLNSYGNEDLSHITDLLKTELVKIPYGMIPKLIEAVHFNDNKPENKNIFLPNKKDNLIKIYRDNKWVYKDKEEALNDLIDNKYTILDSHYEEVTNKNIGDLTPFVKMNYLKFRKYYDEGDKELCEQIKKECDLVLLNNR